MASSAVRSRIEAFSARESCSIGERVEWRRGWRALTTLATLEDCFSIGIESSLIGMPRRGARKRSAVSFEAARARGGLGTGEDAEISETDGKGDDGGIGRERARGRAKGEEGVLEKEIEIVPDARNIAGARARSFSSPYPLSLNSG
jgi:hypothetical protein